MTGNILKRQNGWIVWLGWATEIGVSLQAQEIVDTREQINNGMRSWRGEGCIKD